MPEETANAPEEQKPQTPDAAETAPAPADTVQTPPETVEEAAETVEEAAESAETPDDGLPANVVEVEDAGSLRKKVTITVPRARIDAKFNEMFGELGHSAQVPGFRIGHAPRRLIEKRFGKEVGQDVRNGLLGQALGDALEKADFRPLGEPDLDLEAIELPDQGDMSFSFEIEVAPEFDLPDYENIEITEPSAEVTDQHVEEVMSSYRGQLGVLKPIDGPAAAGDVVNAEARVSGEGVEEGAADNLELRVAPGQVLGIPLEGLGETLEGKAAGETAGLTTKVPAGHPNESWRDKDVAIVLKVLEVKRLELPPVDDALARRFGYDSVEEMRQAIRRGLGRRAEAEIRRSMRDQVARYLLDRTDLEVPEGVASRHAAQLVRRRAIDLMRRGVTREQIGSNYDRIQEQAATQAAEELKLSFILGEIADKEEIAIDETEVNAQIAAIAAQQNRRPERLKGEMTESGQLQQFTDAIVEEKTIDFILDKANIVQRKAEPEGLAEEGPAETAGETAPEGGSPEAGEPDAEDKS